MMIPHILLLALCLALLPVASALNQTAAAIRGYRLQTASFIDSTTPFTAEDVLLRGEPVSKWAGCLPGATASECVVVPAYTDRMSFTYTIDRAYEDLYVHREPVIRLLSPKAAASPSVTFFDVHSTGGDFTVRFRCGKSPAARSLAFELELSVLETASRTVRFHKRCGAGAHPLMNVTAHIGQRAFDASSPGRFLPVAAIYGSATVRLRLDPPARAQALGRPTVRSSNPEVVASLRGLTKKGTLVAGRATDVRVMFECRGRGSRIVMLMVPVGAWNPVFVQLRKRCGRSRAWGMKVLVGGRLAVTGGLVLPRWRVHDAKGEIDVGRVRWVPGIAANVTETEVGVLNAAFEKGEGMFVESVVASVVNASVVEANVVERRAFRTREVRREKLDRGEKKVVFVEYECRSRGASLIVLTVQTLKYKIVELGFTKYCDGPVKNKAVAKLRRMEWIMLAVSLTLMLLLCCVFWQRRLIRRSTAKLRYVEVNSLT